MIERHLHGVWVERPPTEETVAAARIRLGPKFPRAALRRMTHLGLLVGAALEAHALGPDDALVYATTYAETRSLEDYLASFPTASPLLFQTSIQPGAVQQVLIGRQQPVGRLWPVTGRLGLVEQALLTALLDPAPRVLLAGGEERGTLMREHGMASDRSFAFAFALTGDPAGAVARVSFARGAAGAAPSGPTLGALADALAERQPLQWRGVAGAWTLAWP